MDDKEAALKRFNQALKYLKEKRIAITHGEIATAMDINPPVLSNAVQNKDRRFTKGLVQKFV